MNVGAIVGMTSALLLLAGTIYGVHRYGLKGQEGNDWFGLPFIGAFLAGALFDGQLNQWLYGSAPSWELNRWFVFLYLAGWVLGAVFLIFVVRKQKQ